MSTQFKKVGLEEIKALRDLYRHELNCQIIHDSAHYREGCVESYLFESAGEVAGYGSIWVGNYWMEANSVFEIYLLPHYQPKLFSLFESFLRELRPTRIYAQSNDRFLGSLIFDYTQDLVAEHILFSEGINTDHPAHGARFRQTADSEKPTIFPHLVEPVGDWALELDERVIATGGILLHYNRPFADIYMEVDQQFRNRGFGRYLVQELKNLCRQTDRIPAARCRPENIASRQTLQSAGLIPCARLMHGQAPPIWDRPA